MPPSATAATSPYGAVVFDIGGVLLDWNPRYLYRDLFDDPAQMESFLTEICSPEWHRRNDLGPYTRDNCRELAARHPDYATLIMAWADGTERMVAGPVAGSPELVTDLVDQGMALYLLSNMEPESFPLRMERFPFLHLVRGWVVSGFEGVAKPDRRIFDILVERFGLHPASTLFIDDRPDNIAAAAGLGFQTRLFTGTDDVRRHLEEVGVLSAPNDAGPPH
jgi:2-haloacid dehalogenase